MRTFIQIREVKLTILCWLAYLSYAFVYCLIYQELILGNQYAFLESVIWVMQEWGCWLVITPTFLWWMETHRDRLKQIPMNILLITLMTLVGTSGRVILDVWLTSASVTYSVLDFISANLAAAIITMAVWHLASRSNKPCPQQQDAEQEAIWAQLGADQSMVKITSIEYLRSAGNYVEIHSEGREYLVRRPLKSIMENLPAGQFIQTHRSYVFNLDAIDRIVTPRSGAATIRLRKGHSIPLSRNRQKALSQQFAA